MRLFRLCKAQFSESAFSGMGAHDYGGRWNSKGRHCVYLGESRSVCLLETLAHLSDPNALDNFIMFSIEVNDELVLTLPIHSLPENWRQYPAPSELSEIGDEWLESMSSPILLVPSVISLDNNAILNPKHPDSQTIIKLAMREPFSIDPRIV